MTIQLLRPIIANGEIISAGAIIRIDSPEVSEIIIREGIGRIVAAAKEVWPEPMTSLVYWFANTKDLPAQPFELSSYETIFHPVRYYEALRRDIEAGPKGPRSRYGVLQGDLQRLKFYCDQICRQTKSDESEVR
jgi:hypothetical protein